MRNIPLDKLKALLLSKAELIVSALTDNILNCVAANKGELCFSCVCVSWRVRSALFVILLTETLVNSAD